MQMLAECAYYAKLALGCLLVEEDAELTDDFLVDSCTQQRRTVASLRGGQYAGEHSITTVLKCAHCCFLANERTDKTLARKKAD
jgi:hypothetical protein